MKILYIGIEYGTSLHRYYALNRLGHDVMLVDPFSFIPSNRVAGKWIFETGAFGLIGKIKRNILATIQDRHFDIVFVNGGSVIGPELVKSLGRSLA